MLEETQDEQEIIARVAALDIWKAPSTNARSARPATWPSNGAPTAHGPANASAPAESAPAATR
jgi:hypothetical protein